MSISLRDWEEYERGKFHKEIQKELRAWLEDIHLQLEDTTGDSSDKGLHRLGGNAEAVRNCIAMVPNIIETLRVELEDEDD